MTVRKTALLVAALGIAAFATGCGGGGDSSSSIAVSTSSLSKAQFREKAHVICVLGRLKAAKYETPGGQNTPIGQVPPEAIRATFVPTFQEVIDKIQALGAPEGEAQQVEAFLTSMQEGVDTLSERGPSISSVEEIEKPFRASGKLALAVGLNQCVYGE